jgi:hypothetical protein
MYAATIGPAIDLVLFDSHRLTDQNDFAAVCAACDAGIVLCIIGPALKQTPQSRGQSSKAYFFVSSLEEIDSISSLLLRIHLSL